MTTIRKLLVMPLLLAMVAGCVQPPPPEDPGPMHKWFNPHGEAHEEAVPNKCPAQVPIPPDPVDPPRPKNVPDNFNHATFYLSVESVKWRGDKEATIDFEYCIPVSIFVYITANGLAGQIVEIRNKVAVGYTAPWNGLRTTPWLSTVSVYWPPGDSNPIMNFELSAKYETGEGLWEAPDLKDGTVGLSCSIKQTGATLSRQTSLDVHGPVAADGLGVLVTGPFVKCRPEAFAATPM